MMSGTLLAVKIYWQYLLMEMLLRNSDLYDLNDRTMVSRRGW